MTNPVIEGQKEAAIARFKSRYEHTIPANLSYVFIVYDGHSAKFCSDATETDVELVCHAVSEQLRVKNA